MIDKKTEKKLISIRGKFFFISMSSAFGFGITLVLAKNNLWHLFPLLSFAYVSVIAFKGYRSVVRTLNESI